MYKATGEKNGKTVEVVYDGKRWLFNGKTDIALQDEIVAKIKYVFPFGGTFYPNAEDPLNYINVIGNFFFDRPVQVETDEEVQEIDWEEGAVY